LNARIDSHAPDSLTLAETGMRSDDERCRGRAYILLGQIGRNPQQRDAALYDLNWGRAQRPDTQPDCGNPRAEVGGEMRLHHIAVILALVFAALIWASVPAKPDKPLSAACSGLLRLHGRRRRRAGAQVPGIL